MDKSNKNLYGVSMCALFMMVIAASAYFFGKQINPVQSVQLEHNKYVIGALSSGPACVSMENGQVLWSCASEVCTQAEVSECFRSAKTYEAFLIDDKIATSALATNDLEESPQVAGATAVACSKNGGSFTGQQGCVSGQKVLVVGPAKEFTGSQEAPIDGGIFTKSASNNVFDPNRAYNIDKGERVNFAIKVKNNSNATVEDQYDFIVKKLNEAPVGTAIGERTPLCDLQIKQLDDTGQTAAVTQYSQVGVPYVLNAGEVKMLGGAWQPQKNDCGLYKVELRANTFLDQTAKQCSFSGTSNDNIIASTYVRVLGESCSKAESAEQDTPACTYKPFSEWVEQSGFAGSKTNSQAINSPKRLKVFTVPAGYQKRNVKVRYEYAPVGDKNSQTDPNDPSILCGPQSNQEAALQVVGENLINRLYFGGYRFADNEYKDTAFNEITNPNPDPIVAKELNLMLPPGAYSITSNWQGDGQDFWNIDLPNNKYYIDVRNKAKGMVAYKEAVANAENYGPDCKWNGSYKVRAAYCIEGSETNPTAEMQKATITIKNNDLLSNRFFGSVFVNGVKLFQNSGAALIEVQPGKTQTFEFVYQNEFPQTSVLEIVANANSEANASLEHAEVSTIETNEKLLNYEEMVKLSNAGTRLKFAQQ